jgi:uncharacterized repeat protein (TIGR02543 family)
MKELKKRVLSIALAITMVLGMVFIPGGKASTVKAAKTNTPETIQLNVGDTSKELDLQKSWVGDIFKKVLKNESYAVEISDGSVAAICDKSWHLFDGKIFFATDKFYVKALKPGKTTIDVVKLTRKNWFSDWKKTNKRTVFAYINVAKNNATVEANGPQGWTYDGTAHYATLKASDYIKNTDGTVTGVLKDSNGATIKPENMVNAGNYTYTVSSAATDYTNGASRTYSINVAQKTITSKDVTVKDLVYNGSDKSVVVTDGTKTLTEGTDYTVSYTGDRKNVTESGFSAVVTGINNYKGTVTLENQKITAKDVDDTDANAVITYSKTRDWTGEDVKADVAIKVNDTTLVEGTDYKVEYAADANGKVNLKDLGTVKATVKFIGNYKGADKEISYDITATKVLVAILNPGQAAPTNTKTYGSWHYTNLGTAYIKNNPTAMNELKTGTEETAATAVESQMLPFTPYPYSYYWKYGKGATLSDKGIIESLRYTDDEITKYGISIDWFRIQHEPGDSRGLDWHVDGRLVYSQPVTVKFVKSVDGKIIGDALKTVSAKYLSTVEYTAADNAGLTFTGFTTNDGTIKVNDKNKEKCSLTGFSKDTTVILNYTTDKHTVTYVDGVTGETVNTVNDATYAGGATFKGNTDKTGYTFKNFTVNDGAKATVDPKTGALTNVDGDVTVTLNYTVNNYTVRYFDKEGGKLLKEETVPYQDENGKAGYVEAPSYDVASVEGKNVTGWTVGNKEGVSIDQTNPENIDIYASYEDQHFAVNFLNADGTVIETQDIVYGGKATAPKYTLTDDQEFVGWDKDFSNVTSAMDVKLVSKTKEFTVTFVDDNTDETVLDTKTVKYGETATSTATPNRTGYTFTKFGDASNVKSDLTVKAIYTENNYTVSFVDYDGTVISAQSVPYTGAATIPADPTRTGYMFTGWDTHSYIIDRNTPADRVITATYTELAAPVNPVAPVNPAAPTNPAAPANPTAPTAPTAVLPATVVAPAATVVPTAPANQAAAANNQRTAATTQRPAVAVPSDGASTTNDTTTQETINDDKTPLASNSKSEKISDDKTPKAVTEDTCYIHWIMLILIALFGIYNVVRVVKGNKEESEEKANR